MPTDRSAYALAWGARGGILIASIPAAVNAEADVRFKLTNLHGDVIADTASDQATNPGILAAYETDEYGQPRDAGDIGWVRYQYLGVHQRAADNPAGVMLMGVRLYTQQPAASYRSTPSTAAPVATTTTPAQIRSTSRISMGGARPAPCRRSALDS